MGYLGGLNPSISGRHYDYSGIDSLVKKHGKRA